jgi:bacterioferritin-associated ferredoxin
MIICHCELVTDRGIRAAIADGATTVDDVASRCDAGARCGSCRPSISALLAVHLPLPGQGEQEQPAA